MAKLIALLFLAALVAVVSSQYLAGYRGVGLGYAGSPLLARGAYAPHLGYAGAGYPYAGGLGYAGYGARGLVYG